MGIMEINGINDWGDFKAYSTGALETGALILATPFMDDQHFVRSVVLLVDHGPDGSLGFILNRPIELNLYQISEEFKDFRLGLYLGGPVQLDTLHFIHRLGPEYLGDCMEIAPGIYWGGEMDIVKQRIQDDELNPDEINFYIGYAGWSGGQLEQEFEKNSWIAFTARTEYVFSGKDRELWTEVLRDNGVEHKLLSTFPVNPRFN